MVESDKKVMLVEDDETMLSLLQTLLQFEGYQVTVSGHARTLEDIVERIRQEKPSVILLDVNLRYLNGFDLLRDIRADNELNSIRVLMSSGMDYHVECMEAGADGFLLKPYMPDELIQMIRKQLGA